MRLSSLPAVLLGAFAWTANAVSSDDDNVKSITVWSPFG